MVLLKIPVSIKMDDSYKMIELVQKQLEEIKKINAKLDKILRQLS